MSPKHRRCTVRPRAAEKKSYIGKLSLLSPEARDIVSASGVENAVGHCFFDL